MLVRRHRAAAGMMLPMYRSVPDQSSISKKECLLATHYDHQTLTRNHTHLPRRWQNVCVPPAFVPNVVAPSARLRRSQFGILTKPTIHVQRLCSGAQGKAEESRQHSRFIEKLLQMRYRASNSRHSVPKQPANRLYRPYYYRMQ